jgi:predicted acyltransferase
MASAISIRETRDRVEKRAALVTASPTSPAAHRLLSLDAFRGLTIIAMILVNNPGTLERDETYWPLKHAVWRHPTPTDLIYPTFLFIVGMSLAYSLRKHQKNERPGSRPQSAASTRNKAPIEPTVYWRIARRTVILVGLGIFMEFFSHSVNYLVGNRPDMAWSTIRFPGILQRIGLVYSATALIALHIRPGRQATLAVIILLGHGALLTWAPNPRDVQANLSPEGNVARLVDRAIIPDSHLFTQATEDPTDPENLLGTLPAIVNALVGYWTGLAIQRQGVNWRLVLVLMVCSAALLLAALAWNQVLPINKRIWTSSFVLLSSGVSMLGAALCLLMFDVWNWRRLARPFVCAGVNAIFIFVATGLLDRVLLRVGPSDASARAWIFNELYSSWISNPKLASLGFAFTMVAFWWLVVWTMARRGWYVRV